MKRLRSIILLFTLLFPLRGAAQLNVVPRLVADEVSIVCDADSVYVKMRVDCPELKLSAQQQLLVTPVLVPAGNGDSIGLPPLLFVGTTRAKVYDRLRVLDKEKVAFEPLLIRVGKVDAQSFAYKGAVSNQGNLEGGKLMLRQELTGCADCGLDKQMLVLKEGILSKVPETVPEVKVEKPVAYQNRAVELFLDYPVDKSEVLPDFRNNARELAKVAAVMNDLHTRGIVIKSVKITGYASPEGEFRYNLGLSERRAKAMVDFLQGKYGLDYQVMTVDWKGEDWDKLSELLADYQVVDKERVLQIIREVDVLKGRESELMKLHNGVPYRAMKRDLFPALRRIVCELNYIQKE